MSISTHINRISREVSAQATALAELQTALEGKAGIVSAPKTCNIIFKFMESSTSQIASVPIRGGVMFYHVENGVSKLRYFSHLNGDSSPDQDDILFMSSATLANARSIIKDANGYETLQVNDVACGSVFILFTSAEDVSGGQGGSITIEGFDNVVVPDKSLIINTGCMFGLHGCRPFHFQVPDAPGQTLNATILFLD